MYLFGLKEYKPVVRPAVLTGFLGYFFVVVGLCYDLGQPWRLPYPMLVSYGVTSVLFLVGWHVALYLATQLVEFSEGLGARLIVRNRRILGDLRVQPRLPYGALSTAITFDLDPSNGAVEIFAEIYCM